MRRKKKGTIQKGILGKLTMSNSRRYKPLRIPKDSEEAANLLTPAEIQEMERIAMSKSPYAKKVEKDLQRYYQRLAKMANQALAKARDRELDLEAISYIEFAIKQEFGEGAYFPQTRKETKNITLVKLVSFLEDLQIYTQSSEFDSEELGEEIEEVAKRFEERGYHFEDDSEKVLLYKYLKTDAYRTLSSLVGSDVIVDDIRHLMNEGIKMEKIIEEFKKILKPTDYLNSIEALGGEWWTWDDYMNN